MKVKYMRMWRAGFGWSSVLVILALSGCGSSGSEGRQGLSGEILLDGQRVAAGTISFAPEQGLGKAASTMFSDGQYKIEAKKGLAPGKYVVKIFANAVETDKPSPEDLMTGRADVNRPETPEQTIPPEYNTSSTQVIEVTANGPNKFDFDIKSK